MASVAPIPRSRPRRTDFGFGYLLGNTFSIWFGSLLVFVPATLVLFAPALLFQLWHVNNVMDHVAELTPGDIQLRAVLGAFLQMFCSALSAAVFSFAVVRRLQRRPVGIAEALRVGLARLPAALGISFLVALPVAAAVVPGLLMAGRPAAIPVVILCSVAAIWILVVWSLAIPATVIEGLGVLGSLTRSAALTRGFRGSIFGTWLLMGLIVGLVLTPLMVVIFKGSPRDALGDLDSVLSTWARKTWVETGVQVLLQSLQAVGVAVAYFGLRGAKESMTPEELVKAFE